MHHGEDSGQLSGFLKVIATGSKSPTLAPEQAHTFHSAWLVHKDHSPTRTETASFSGSLGWRLDLGLDLFCLQELVSAEPLHLSESSRLGLESDVGRVPGASPGGVKSNAALRANVFCKQQAHSSLLPPQCLWDILVQRGCAAFGGSVLPHWGHFCFQNCYSALVALFVVFSSDSPPRALPLCPPTLASWETCLDAFAGRKISAGQLPLQLGYNILIIYYNIYNK